MPSNKERRITAKEQRDLRFGRAVKLLTIGGAAALIIFNWAHARVDPGKLDPQTLAAQAQNLIPDCVGSGCPPETGGASAPADTAAPAPASTDGPVTIDVGGTPITFTSCTSPAHDPASVLGCGANDQSVCALQAALVAKGFAVEQPEVDLCVFGASTAAAVTAAQTSLGLDVDGLAGPQTRTALGI